MNCPTCGSALGPQALFCGTCGVPIASDDARIEESLELKNVAAQRRGRSAHAAEVTGAVSDTAEVSSRTSFKGAMANAHRKARRKMPVLVLVALFMLAATTIAWAVYTVINPTLVNEREIDWTPEAVYEAMQPDRFDLKSMLEKLLAVTREPTVPVKVPASIAEAEGDRLNFVVEEDDESHVVIYYRAVANGSPRIQTL